MNEFRFYKELSINFQTLACLSLLILQNLKIFNIIAYLISKMRVKSQSQSHRDKAELKPTQELTKAELYIKNVLMGRVLYEKSSFDDQTFKSALVLKVLVPTLAYVKRSQKVEIGSLLRNYPLSMFKSYEAAYEQLFRDMQIKGDDISKSAVIDRQLQIRNFASFAPLKQKGIQQKNKKINLHTKEFSNEQELVLSCQEEATGILDSFTIYFNALCYSLQHICGFKVKSFMVSQFANKEPVIKSVGNIKNIDLFQQNNQLVKRRIFILLNLPENMLIKAANKYQIKKQVDYTQVDPYLNDPTDKANRPLRFHSQIRNYVDKYFKTQTQKIDVGDDISENPELCKLKVEPIQKRKKIDRKIGFILPEHINKNGPKVMNEAKLSKNAIQRYLQFCEQLNKQLQQMMGQKQKQDNTNPKPQRLSAQQRQYLYIVNRGKINRGVQKQFIQIKKKRKYWKILEKVSQKYKYKTFKNPKLYANFTLVNKKKKFFSRLEKVLVYKQMKVSPFGDLSLFNKMQRIKLSYLVLKSNIRVQNFHSLNMQVFTLSDQFQKSGEIGQLNSNKFYYHYKKKEKESDSSIQGGLNGENLEKNWCRIFVCNTSIDTIRNYLGESKAMQIFIKTYMIQLFSVLAPFAAIFQFLKIIFIDIPAESAGYMPQVYFFMIYMAIVSFSYGVFIQKYSIAEQNFIRNYVQQPAYVEFMDQYKGPYKRDILTDNANTYNQREIQIYKSLKQNIIIASIFFIFCTLVGFQVGFYYGIRFFIIQFANKFPNISDSILSFIRPLHLIGYSIYFVTNSFLDKTLVLWLANFFTRKQNRATREQFVKSSNLKRLIFAVLTELIGPIDIVYIQYISKTNCYSSWCASEFRSYAYCRFIIVIAFSLYYTLQRIVKACLRRAKKKKSLSSNIANGSSLSYSKKLYSFLQFVYKQSEKQQCKDFDTTDQAISLVHFGIFICVFPFAPVLSLIYMMFSYNIDRQEILNSQRPIPKIQKIHTFTQTVTVIGHLLLFFNFSYLFITLQWFQYNFPDILISVSDKLSINSVMTTKFVGIFLFFFVYQVIVAIGKSCARKFSSVLHKRMYNMYKKYQMKIFNQGNTITLKEPKPLHSISRTYEINIKGRGSLGSQDNYQSCRELYVEQQK